MTTVVIDPGHGGSQTGATVDGIAEKNINLAISLELAQVLAETWGNYLPILTRYTNTNITLHRRCKFANIIAPECFVSVHCNSFSSGKPRGFEIFTTRGVTQADKLANTIFKEVKFMLPNLPMRPDISDGDLDKEAGFEVLRGTKCPAVLVECGFMSNKSDLDMLLSKTFQLRLASALAAGITGWTL